MVDVFTNFTLVVGLITGFSIIAFVIWNGAKKIGILEKQNDTDKLTLKSELARIQEQHLKDVAALQNEIQRQVIERRDDIARTAMQAKEEYVNLQKQLDSTKADIKGLLAKIEVAYSNIASSGKTHDEIKDEIKELMAFHSDWNQRIEDTNKDTMRMIQDLRDEFQRMFASFHGHCNCNGNGNK